MSKPFGITVGDSSGVGPEILLKAIRENSVSYPIVVYGDRGALDWYNRELGYGVDLDAVPMADHGILQAEDVTPGKINAKSGMAAREYVVSATKAALAGDIA